MGTIKLPNMWEGRHAARHETDDNGLATIPNINPDCILSVCPRSAGFYMWHCTFNGNTLTVKMRPLSGTYNGPILFDLIAVEPV